MQHLSIRLSIRVPSSSCGPRSCRPRLVLPWPLAAPARTSRRHLSSSVTRRADPASGTNTHGPDKLEDHHCSKSPFYFIAGYALFAKRPSRPFPPPFLSTPSNSFSDPLSTHNRSKDKRQYYEGEVIRGITNGDDAVLVSDHLIAANDGVGQWAQKEKGHAALWSRLILHFWALSAERDAYAAATEADACQYLQKAFELTKEATSSPTEWFGTTTASGALLGSGATPEPKPVLHITQLGDSQILVVRPRTGDVVYKTKEQWHWFDCPRQLGTNSPDTPEGNAVTEKVEIEEEDIVLAMSDGVVDNLWEHEVVTNVLESLKKAEKQLQAEDKNERQDGMRFVASELVKAAQVIAQDPYAECPFMERAIEEGLPMEGGKLDDISVVAALCRRR